MKTPEKAAARIRDIAEHNLLTDIVEKYGVDYVWQMMKTEIRDDIFTPLSVVCRDVLNELAINGAE